MHIRWDAVNTFEVPLAQAGFPDANKLVVEVHEDLNLPTTRFLKVLRTEIGNSGTLRIFVDTSKEEAISR
jgi:hypothetical protein